jgi:hypothetical protein
MRKETAVFLSSVVFKNLLGETKENMRVILPVFGRNFSGEHVNIKSKGLSLR